MLPAQTRPARATACSCCTCLYFVLRRTLLRSGHYKCKSCRGCKMSCQVCGLATHPTCFAACAFLRRVQTVHRRNYFAPKTCARHRGALLSTHRSMFCTACKGRPALQTRCAQFIDSSNTIQPVRYRGHQANISQRSAIHAEKHNCPLPQALSRDWSQQGPRLVTMSQHVT